MSSLPLDPNQVSPLSPESLDRMALAVINRGLSVPAIFFLELNKPLSTILHQSLVFSEPLGHLLFGKTFMREAQSLCSSRDSIEALIKRIEELAARPKMERSA